MGSPSRELPFRPKTKSLAEIERTVLLGVPASWAHVLPVHCSNGIREPRLFAYVYQPTGILNIPFAGVGCDMCGLIS
jgi:hypothetical protein